MGSSLTNFFTNMSGMPTAILVIMIVVGVIIALFGLKLTKALLAVFGFLCGTFSTLAIFLTNASSWGWPDWAIYLVAILVGIVVAAISYKIYKLGVFVVCLFMSYTTMMNFLMQVAKIETLGSTTTWVIIVSAVVGIIVGILAVIFTKQVLIIITSIHGAYLIAVGFSSIFTLATAVAWVIFAVAAAVGIFLQMIMNKGSK